MSCASVCDDEPAIRLARSSRSAFGVAVLVGVITMSACGGGSDDSPSAPQLTISYRLPVKFSGGHRDVKLLLAALKTRAATITSTERKAA